MEKEVKLFDKRFVYFMWDDELKGKKVFISNDIDNLRGIVEKGTECNLHSVISSGDESAPFESANGVFVWQFAYYDPNYEVKKAFNEGKTIQFKKRDCFAGWVDCDEPLWSEECSYRIKPEDEKWIVYLRRSENGEGKYLTSCEEKDWEKAKETYNAKTKIFVGSYDQAIKWYQLREKFKDLIKAWEDGKEIQFYDDTVWCDVLDGKPLWNPADKYRVKPKEKCYRPYESSAEMIADFIDRFKVNCPSYCEPLIWVRLKCDGRERLIVAFGKGFGTDFVEIGNKAKAVPLQKLFEDYEFLDGQPCGIKEE